MGVVSEDDSRFSSGRVAEEEASLGRRGRPWTVACAEWTLPTPGSSASAVASTVKTHRGSTPRFPSARLPRLRRPPLRLSSSSSSPPP